MSETTTLVKVTRGEDEATIRPEWVADWEAQGWSLVKGKAGKVEVPKVGDAAPPSGAAPAPSAANPTE